jgi:hypothetical protein
VVLTRSQILLLGGRLLPFLLRSGRWAGGAATLTAFHRRPLSKRRLSLLPFHTAPVVGCVFSFTAAALKLLLRGIELP